MVVLFNLLEENIFSKFSLNSEQLFTLELINANKSTEASPPLILQNLVRRGFIADGELTPKGGEVINSLNMVIISV